MYSILWKYLVGVKYFIVSLLRSQWIKNLFENLNKNLNLTGNKKIEKDSSGV